ncbi:hypothetical protein ACFV0H_35605 [Streptomyces erythrochromogenes]|uniref:hypothetical protein n=1 Tax=Streptomyces erythrochromogenes TaxID=285574 RepID=UPI000AD175AF|nr:hypothetical protein [Streptomyces erythrochromogenes]MCX5585886.1 hypothetical protein [Streptomyces erythrochromogenes]
MARSSSQVAPASSFSRMRARYMHVTGPMLKNVAKQIGDALWGAAEEAPDPN